MEPITSFLILAIVLIVLAAIVVISLSKRAKNDPESLKNEFFDFSEFKDLELYETIDRYDENLKAPRSARPKYPDSNDYREWFAALEERSRQEQAKEIALEDLELW